jgi:hypothetical protein
MLHAAGADAWADARRDRLLFLRAADGALDIAAEANSSSAGSIFLARRLASSAVIAPPHARHVLRPRPT